MYPQCLQLSDLPKGAHTSDHESDGKGAFNREGVKMNLRGKCGDTDNSKKNFRTNGKEKVCKMRMIHANFKLAHKGSPSRTISHGISHLRRLLTFASSSGIEI